MIKSSTPARSHSRTIAVPSAALALLFAVSLPSLSQAAQVPAQSGPAKTIATRPDARRTQKSARSTSNAPPSEVDKSTDAQQQAEFDAIVAMQSAEARITRLQRFLKNHPRSQLHLRATELLVSAHAAFGDELLQSGDSAAGVEQFKLAVAEAPDKLSDKLYSEVVAKLPTNLFVRKQRAASIELALEIEKRVVGDAPRLLVLAAFYLGIEDGAEATRLAESAVASAPDLAAAHRALAAAHRVSLQLDQAANEFSKALTLDPSATGAKRGLADMRRALGNSAEAVTLYRELLATDPADEFARTGEVLALFDLGKQAEAEQRLDAALKDNPHNLALLVGAAYWYAAHDKGARAIELGQLAVTLEPRYTWGHVALARGLAASHRYLEAEGALRIAQSFGSYPTLSYELARILAATGYYDEANAELARWFTVSDAKLQTRLAGRIPTQADNFIDLLAPERRASIFQPAAADSETEAKLMQSLLTLNTVGPDGKPVDEAAAARAAHEFSAGTDEMRTYRRLYAATKLLRMGVAFADALELTQSAISGLDAALNATAAPTAVMADGVAELRASAHAQGRIASVPDIKRSVLSDILRGRIEDLAGWTLFNQDKSAEAVVRLKRALSVLPENSYWWRSTMWHLGAALDASGKPRDALLSYYKSYNNSEPDPARRATIEALYRRINGSLDGLDDKIGPSPFAPQPVSAASPAQEPAVANTQPVSTVAAPVAPAIEAAAAPLAQTTQPAEATAATTGGAESLTTLQANTGSAADRINAQRTAAIVLPPVIDAAPVQTATPGPANDADSVKVAAPISTVSASPVAPGTADTVIMPTPTPAPAPVTTPAALPTSTPAALQAEPAAVNANQALTPTAQIETTPTVSPKTNVAETTTQPVLAVSPESAAGPTTSTVGPNAVPAATTSVAAPAATTPETTTAAPNEVVTAAEPSESRPRLVTGADGTSTSGGTLDQSSPTQAYKSLYAAVQRKDIVAIRQLLSKSTIDFMTVAARLQRRTLDDVIRHGLMETTSARRLPETRNESAGASTGRLEVRNEQTRTWDTVPFIKEDGLWRLAAGELYTGSEPQTVTQAPQPADVPGPRITSQAAPRIEVVNSQQPVIDTSAAPKTPPAAPDTVATTTAATVVQPAQPETPPCVPMISSEEIALLRNGGTGALTVTLEGMETAGEIIPSTSNEADIAIFPEPEIRRAANAMIYTITSISNRTGVFSVTFRTACGRKDVRVVVR